MKLGIIFIFIFSSTAFSSEIDERLNFFINRFNLMPIEKIEDKNPALTSLEGSTIF